MKTSSRSNTCMVPLQCNTCIPKAKEACNNSSLRWLPSSILKWTSTHSSNTCQCSPWRYILNNPTPNQCSRMSISIRTQSDKCRQLIWILISSQWYMALIANFTILHSNNNNFRDLLTNLWKLLASWMKENIKGKFITCQSTNKNSSTLWLGSLQCSRNLTWEDLVWTASTIDQGWTRMSSSD